MADRVAQTTTVILSVNPDLEKPPAYTLNRVKSTKVETTTAVPINASFDNPALIRKALLKAPWLPESPPKKPLNAPPSGNLLLSNCRFRFGIRSMQAKI